MKIILMMLLSVVVVFALDINSASIKELTTLKGVGEVKAEAIISFRKSHCFKNVNELSLVKGIGKKTVLLNKKDLTAGSCKE